MATLRTLATFASKVRSLPTNDRKTRYAIDCEDGETGTLSAAAAAAGGVPEGLVRKAIRRRRSVGHT